MAPIKMRLSDYLYNPAKDPLSNCTKSAQYGENPVRNAVILNIKSSKLRTWGRPNIAMILGSSRDQYTSFTCPIYSSSRVRLSLHLLPFRAKLKRTRTERSYGTFDQHQFNLTVLLYSLSSKLSFTDQD